MDVIVQPVDGIAPLLETVHRARKTLDFIVFRLDLKEIEKAAEAAVARGVNVRALIAHTHKGPDKRLRQLEQRMLEKGVTVSRSGDELVRYHGKLMVVDREELQVYGFNYTTDDLKSRSFGVITRDRRLVQEALRLFEADSSRQEFEPMQDHLVVSPENARGQPPRAEAAGPAAPRPRDDPRRRHGVRGEPESACLELDARREVGLIVRDPNIVKRLQDVFDDDWARTDVGKKEQKQFTKDQKLAAADNVEIVVSD